MAVDFYHLALSPMERVLPQICEKLLAAGERLLVVADAALLEHLDGQLWSHSRDAFLPHGRSTGASPEVQPILLSSSAVEPVNKAANIVIADGRWREEALDFARTFYFFGNAEVNEARENWRALKARPEIELRYWKQDERGKWVQGP